MKKILWMALLFTVMGTMAFAQKEPGVPKQTAEERTEMRLKRLDKNLTLTDVQKESLKKDLLRIEQERDKAHEASMANREKQKALREEEKTMLKKTLTEEQYKKLEAQQAERQQLKKERGMGKGPGGAPAGRQAP